MNKIFLSICLFTSLIYAQDNDQKMLKNLYNTSLTNSNCYSWLDYLSNQIGSRMSGSVGAEKAVTYTKQQLETLGLDRVYLQEVMVPNWIRGEKETAYILDNKNKINVPICALGGSIATSKAGLTAEIIEVQGIEQMEKLGTDKIKGKIVFYNRPFEPTNINAFQSYGGCVDQRFYGAEKAAKMGAVGTIVRSMGFRLDDFPHTGMQSYGDLPKDKYIPTAAISTNGAELLSRKLKANSNLKFFMKLSCETHEEVLSYNVIGEIKGSEHPEKVMIVGGHLDSWDLADGSHDDGAGVVQSMAVLQLFRKLDYKPKNTIRAVLFMNEEFGGKGGKKYAEAAKENKENHIFALESDCGGFSPRGFSLECDANNYQKVMNWKYLFEPYYVHSFTNGHPGSDVNHLKSEKIVKAGLKPDSQRYFDYHHAGNDKFDAINKRELELGAATMASLIYLFDQYGID